jgi:hypothetical protein
LQHRLLCEDEFAVGTVCLQHLQHFDEFVKVPISSKFVIPAKQTVSQYVKDVIPDSPAQPGMIRNPAFSGT